jgi:ATP-dependent protease ClpP protease subunit
MFKNEEPLAIKKNDSDYPSANISIFDTSIYFYSEIDDDSIFGFIKSLKEVEMNLLCQSLRQGSSPPIINFHINSPGGSVLCSFSGINAITNCKVPVYSIIDGYCASGGTVLSVVANRRFMYKHSYMLIHQLSSMCWGTFEELRDDMRNSIEFMKRIRGIYKQYTKIPNKELNKILKHDLWFNSKKCLEYGLVDEII